MNFIKKFFTKKKTIPEIQKIFYKKTSLKKKIFKYFLYFLITIFLICGIFIYSFLGEFKKFFFNIPQITGFFGEKNYLVLMLNNSEIRPGGGFISSFAEVKFFMGIPKINIKNSYDIGNPNPLIQPPYPYDKLFGEDVENYKGRVFRDGNLSPDFEINAKKIIEIYNKSKNNDIKEENLKKIDGVFSVDMNFLESLLKISGEVEVEGKKFNENNFFYQTQILSKDFDLHSIEDLNSRKNFLKPLINEIFTEISKKIFYGNFNIVKKIVNEIKKLADQKHIQGYFSDEKLQNKIENFGHLNGLSGKFFPKGEDFISVNISNIGGRKADRYIRKNYFYDVDFSKSEEGENPIGELKITTKHLGTKSLISDFYQGYYKIYLPKGIEILEAKTDFKDKIKINNGENSELNSTVIGGLVHMQPGEEMKISIKYKLPQIVNSENYNLHLITQAGGNGENWNISVKEKTDNILNSETFETKENLAFFDGKIFKDKILNLKNFGDKTPPIIVWQKFIKDDLIEINFSEKISEKFLEDEENFSIRKIKKTIGNKITKNNNTENNKIKILKKYIKGNNLYLQLDGIIYKKREFYEVLIKNIQDLSGNETSKNPMKITVIQK